MVKKRILAILSTPPPVHGSALMNNYVFKSNLLREAFCMDYIHYNFVKKVSEIGDFNFKKIIKFFRYFFLVFYKLLFNKPDLVYFPIVPYGSSFYRDSILVLLIKIFKIPLVYHLHGKGAIKHYSKAKKIYDFVYKNVNIICLSKSLTDDVSFANGHIHIIPNGIEQKIYQSKKNYNEKANLLYLSNFVKEKGVLQLLSAVVLIKSKGVSDFKLNLVGGFTKEIDREFIENFISSYNLEENVIIRGPLYNKDKEDVLKESDIFCFPTYYKNEAFPLVNLEAMQFSLPVISSSEGGIPDLVVDGYNGFLVDPFDTEKLANSIISLITDKQLRISMSKNSFKRFSENYTLKIFEKNLLKTFSYILDE